MHAISDNKAKVLLLFLLLISVASSGAAQEQEKGVARLKLEHNRLRAIAADKNISAEIRELNMELLEKNKKALREAIPKGISDLEEYKTKMVDILDEKDLVGIKERIEAHKYDLAQIPDQTIERPNSEGAAVNSKLQIAKTDPNPTPLVQVVNIT